MKKAICVLLGVFAAIAAIRLPVRADSAVAAAVINGDTGEILYAKNKDARLPMASTAKIMTALLLCEAFPDLTETVTVSKQAVSVEGTGMGLSAGDRISLYGLLCGMLLASGNDAANAAAYAVSGSTEAFVKLMNRKAKELGLLNTSFATPSGLDGENHYTTARDLAYLAMYALKNETVARVCAMKTAAVEFGDPPVKHVLKNHNRLLFDYGDVCGVKTGYTKKAGRCLVSAARRDGTFVIAVTLNDKNDWADHRALLNTGYSLLINGRRVTESARISVPAANGKSVTVFVPGYGYYSSSPAPVTCKIYLPGMLYAPQKKGEAVGCAEYYYEYRPVKRVVLTAGNGVAAEEYTFFQKTKALFWMIITGMIRR